jgi:hypothetical protein
MNDKLNPEVIKAGAEMVRPDIDWLIVAGYVAMDDELNGQFHPDDPADAHALMLALMKDKDNGWVFDYYEGVFRGAHPAIGMETQEDESFPLLLLKCVSSMKELPLYV